MIITEEEKLLISIPDIGCETKYPGQTKKHSGYRFFVLLYIVISFSLIQPAGAQQECADTIFIFSARLVNSISGESVQFAHIVNKTRITAIISDSLGYFRIYTGLNDLLVVTAIGYYDFPVHINDSLIQLKKIHILKLIPKIYPISEVKVYPLGTYNQFKYKVLNLELPEPKARLHPSILPDIETGIDTLNIVEPFMIMSPISAIYNLFSREAKSLRKLEEIQKEEYFYKQIGHKYNLEMLERITGLKGEELYEFTSFCNFSREFLLEASEYEIIEAILIKLKDYKEGE